MLPYIWILKYSIRFIAWFAIKTLNRLIWLEFHIQMKDKLPCHLLFDLFFHHLAYSITESFHWFIFKNLENMWWLNIIWYIQLIHNCWIFGVLKIKKLIYQLGWWAGMFYNILFLRNLSQCLLGIFIIVINDIICESNFSWLLTNTLRLIDDIIQQN